MSDIERLLREVAEAYHEAAIPLDTEPLHPATTWALCSEPLCVRVRAFLDRDTVDLAGIRDFAHQFAAAGRH